MSESRAKVREVTLEIIEEKGYVITSDVAARIKNIHSVSIAQFLHHNYREWGLSRRHYGKDLSQRRWAYAKDIEKIPPAPPLPKKITKLKPKRPKKIEELIERARVVNQKPKKPSVSLTSPKYEQKPGESLDNWLIRIHIEKKKPLSFNEVVDLYRSSLDKKPTGGQMDELSDRVRKLVEDDILGFEKGKTYYEEV